MSSEQEQQFLWELHSFEHPIDPNPTLGDTVFHKPTKRMYIWVGKWWMLSGADYIGTLAYNVPYNNVGWYNTGNELLYHYLGVKKKDGK